MHDARRLENIYSGGLCGRSVGVNVAAYFHQFPHSVFTPCRSVGGWTAKTTDRLNKAADGLGRGNWLLHASG